jgi:hypothetical protein
MGKPLWLARGFSNKPRLIARGYYHFHDISWFPKSWGYPQIIQVLDDRLSTETTMVIWGSPNLSMS